MKKKKHKGNPYRDPDTGQFTVRSEPPRKRPLLNWGLIGLLALTVLIWAAIGITLKGWLQ